MEERCVCCGRIIPEGQQVCMLCEKKAEQGNRKTGSPSSWGCDNDISMVSDSGGSVRAVCRRDDHGNMCGERWKG